MGITGLLKGLSPLLIPINEKIPNPTSSTTRHGSKPKPKPRHNIRQFKHKSIAIDASSWLYKAAYSISSRLVEAVEENRIDPVCERVLCQYMIKRCEELLHHAEIRRIYLVFDGERCPLKAITNEEREAKRKEHLAEARRLSKLGLTDKAMEKYKLCIKVVPWMAHSVAKAVSKKWKEGHSGMLHMHKPRVSCVMSPYEADAQMVKLVLDGLVDAVVTEDSDVLVYSAACNRSFPILYKLDRDGGDCDVISMDWLLSPSKFMSTVKQKDSSDMTSSYPSLLRLLPCQHDTDHPSGGSSNIPKQKKGAGSALLSHLMAFVSRESRNPGAGARMFVQACVLSGCDYAPSQLSGVGIVTSFKIIKENAHREPNERFLHALKSFPKDKITSVPLQQSSGGQPDHGVDSFVKGYEEVLAKSECVFYHHRVLDKHGNIVPLVALKNDASNMSRDDKNSRIPADYIPTTDRFENESFLYNIESHAKIQHRSQVLASTTQHVVNPYRHGKHSCTPKNIKSATVTPKYNLFSVYAHDSSNSSVSKSKQSHTAAHTHHERKIKERDNTDSSNEELDDISSSPEHRHKPKQISSFFTKHTTSLRSKNNDDAKKESTALRSKYFFPHATCAATTPSASQSLCISSSPKFVRTVTPSMSDLQGRVRDENEHAASDDFVSNKSFSDHGDDNDSNDDDAEDDCIILEEPAISSRSLHSFHSRTHKTPSYCSTLDGTNHSQTRQHADKSFPSNSSWSENDDDDECIILDERPAISSRSSTTPSVTNTQHSYFTTTFAQAQSQGTRARFSSSSSSPPTTTTKRHSSRSISASSSSTTITTKRTKSKRRNDSKALLGSSSAAKKAKPNLITGFFARL